MFFGCKQQKITLANNKFQNGKPEIIYKIAERTELSGLGKTQTKEVLGIPSTTLPVLCSGTLPWSDSALTTFHPFVSWLKFRNSRRETTIGLTHS